jgi:hypothetical protein
MPRGDGTGPAGMGPTTGRAAGWCAGYGSPGFVNRGPGWEGSGGRGGFGAGRGGGRGHRNWYWATGLTGWQRGAMPMAPYAYGPPAAPYQPTRNQELSMLRSQVTLMQDSLESAQERIQELEKESDTE